MVRHFYNSPGALLWFIMFDSQGAPSLFISSVIYIGHQHNSIIYREHHHGSSVR